jgi:intein/homing endonuclease
MGRPKGSKDKVNRKFAHCFSRQFLKDHNTQIFRGEEQVLTPVQHLYDIKLPNTKYYVGDSFIEQGETQFIKSYEVLRQMGFVIVSTKVGNTERWDENQVVKYELKRIGDVEDHLGRLPTGKYPAQIEYDAYNKALRLVGSRTGPNGYGIWISIDKDKKVQRGMEGGKKLHIKTYGEDSDNIISSQIESWLGIEQEMQPIKIKEAAFMISDANEIVCFPRLPDMPSILISGMKGCLTKDTLIDMPRDLKKYPKGVPMADLLDKKDFDVYSFNVNKQMFEIKKAQSCEYSKTADVYELELTTGEIIKATEDHPFLLKNRTYKQLKYLIWNKGKNKLMKYDKEKVGCITTDRLMLYTRVSRINKEKFGWGLGVIHQIRYAGVQEVYDIVGVEDNKNYVANGFIVSNTGKSFCLHSLVDRFFWKPAFDFKIVILNDSSRETGTWCFPNSDKNLIMKLKQLNERPLPLPTVYLHPKVKEDYETLYIKPENTAVGYFITIPFREIIENHKEYLKIEGSVRYFTKFKDQLKNCTTQQEAEALLDVLATDKSIPFNTMNKIRAELDQLFDTKMTDISSERQFPWVVSKSERAYNPLTACVHAGVLPILETEYVSNSRELLSIYFTYFVKDLFMRQKQDPDFIAQRSEILLVVDECFVSETMISTEKGPKSIGGLYRQWKAGNSIPKIMSYNETSCLFEYNEIEKCIRKESEDLLVIDLGVSKIKCTPNHEFHTRRGWVQAQNLVVGDLLTEHYKEDIKNGMRNYEGDQLQIILGGFLGDGYLYVLPSKNYRMSFVHGIQQKKYLEWKQDILDGKPIHSMKSGYTEKDNIYRFNTGMFNLYEDFKTKNEVPEWVLDKLDERGLSIWYMDDGSINIKDGRPCGCMLHTNSYDLDTHVRFKKMFQQKWGIDCEIRKTREYYSLRFNKKNSERLFDIIKNYMHPDLYYKCGKKVDMPYEWSKQNNDKGWMRVKKVVPFKNISTWRQKKPYVYDLTVKGNHTYIVCGSKATNGVVVHNCHNISQKGLKSGADMLLRRCVREGRPRRIGTLLATQKFSELPDVIKDNTTYLICFKNPGEAAEIANQYKLGKNAVELITDLEKHECVAYTTDYFIVYDSYGKKRKSKPNEFFKGRTLPPYSEHKRPKKEGINND